MKSATGYKMIMMLVVIGGILISSAHTPWGFYGHKLINKMAVFTLPQDVLVFYKQHIHYISEHAVDPDKRRYALKNEAYRHYIDLDHWGTYPFDNVPRDLKAAIQSHAELKGITLEGDTLNLTSSIRDSEAFFKEFIQFDQYSVVVNIDPLDAKPFLNDTLQYSEVIFKNHFAEYGVLPFFLEHYFQRLVKAFESGDVDFILKISADIGHYISDAHVPLHTTENYNGQLTDQLGIHAFWESRLPELFAEEDYDMLVGKAIYIIDKEEYFWNIVLDSHQLLAEVLNEEWNLKQSFPEDRQFCFDKRGDYTVRTQCPEYAKAYHEALGGMVEQRMRDAILATGSVWYSAWIDAGQPDLDILVSNLDEEQLLKQQKELEAAKNANEIYGRSHGN